MVGVDFPRPLELNVRVAARHGSGRQSAVDAGRVSAERAAGGGARPWRSEAGGLYYDAGGSGGERAKSLGATSLDTIPQGQRHILRPVEIESPVPGLTPAKQRLLRKNSMEFAEPDFEIAAFDPSGLLLGTSKQKLCDLSEKWLAITTAFLASHGANFKADWGGPFAHLVTQVTSADGVALVSFYADGVMVVSAALLCGMKPDAELSVLKMFVQSLRKTEVVRASAVNEIPFEDIFHIMSRPLMMVVPWGDERVREQDDELVQELALHLGAAYFQAYKTPKP